MVLEVDLSDDNISNEKDPNQNTDISIKKTSLLKRIKNKFRRWQVNLSKTPTSHKLLIFFLILGITGLASVAFVYAFIIVSDPQHESLDTSYQLLSVNP